MVKDIQVITGCMFAGKTTALLNRLKKYNKNYLLVKPKVDTRNTETTVVTHGGIKAQALTVHRLSDVFNQIKGIQLIAIDEAQFFPTSIIEDINYLLLQNIQIIIAGLEKDYLNKPFGAMKEIIEMSNSITRLQAICNKCGNPASYSHRIAFGANKQVLVGDSNQYEALCKKCFENITQL